VCRCVVIECLGRCRTGESGSVTERQSQKKIVQSPVRNEVYVERVRKYKSTDVQKCRKVNLGIRLGSTLNGWAGLFVV
jgi:hypothetical protein